MLDAGQNQRLAIPASFLLGFILAKPQVSVLPFCRKHLSLQARAFPIHL
jgi:hypothetical protein